MCRFFKQCLLQCADLFDFFQLFHIPFALKFEPEKIEIFCFLPLKAEIHGFFSPPHLARLKTTAWRLMG
jgi:hypothetical protein